MYSPEEIEKKRQAALQKLQSRKLQQQSQQPATKPTNSTNLAKIFQPQKRKNDFDSGFSSSSKQFKQDNGSKTHAAYTNGKQFPKLQNNNASSSKLLHKSPFKSFPSNPEIERSPTLKKSLNPTAPSNGSINKQVQTNEPKMFYGRSATVQGTCYMISDSRFEINVPFHQQLIELFKKFTSSLYNIKTKLWNFNITEYEKIMADIKTNIENVSLVGIPNFIVRTFLKKLNSDDHDTDIDISCIDQQLRDVLMPFQKEGIIYGIKRNGRCIIADDMGLGKTIQALGIAHYYKKDWPLLIVTPSSIRYQWSDTIYKYLPSIPVHDVYHYTKSKEYLEDAPITIVSYDILMRSIDAFEAKIYKTIILDESHALKNQKTARTKAVQRLAFNVIHMLLLSGTPALSRPVELYTQISLITRSFMRFQEYGIRYCAAEKKPFGWDYSGASNLGELQLLMKAHCLLRRLKNDVLKQLPPKIREVVILDPDLIPKKSKEILKIEKKLEQSTSKNRQSSIIEYYNESSDQRLKAVCSYINDLTENDQKFLVYAHHVSILDGICEILNKKRIKYIRIDGGTSSENRKNNVDLFQSSDQCMVAVLSITAANAGLTLTAANFVVFAELYWNPGILAQAEDRVHRIGQDRGVVIRYLVGKNTVDDYLWPLIQNKSNFLTSAGLNLDFSLNNAKVSNQHEPNKIDKYLATSQENVTKAENNAVTEVVNDVDKLFENEEDFTFEDEVKF